MQVLTSEGSGCPTELQDFQTPAEAFEPRTFISFILSPILIQRTGSEKFSPHFRENVNMHSSPGDYISAMSSPLLSLSLKRLGGELI